MPESIKQIKTFLGFPDFSQLFPPPETGTYKYFEKADKFPFDFNAMHHSSVNAWWMAEYSLLAYCEQSEVEQVLNNLLGRQNYSLFWVNSENTNTQGFAVITTDYVLITFRGTEFPRPTSVLKSPSELRDMIADILTDIKKLPPQIINNGTPAFENPVHPGFATALQSVWPQLQSVLSKSGPKPIWLTGHSLGGALSTLLANQISDRVQSLYTFGSPCVGNSEFTQKFETKSHLGDKTFRYVHGNDAVPAAFTLLNMDYQHVGQLFHLDAGIRRGVFAQLMNLALAFTIKLNQFDHAPILYSYECWNKIIKDN
jgi:triacylglycerol lipase